MSRLILFPTKYQFLATVVVELIFFVTHTSSISSIESLENKVAIERIDFCSMCETSSICFKNGLNWWIAQIPKDEPRIYQNYVSILPPENKNNSCKIPIRHSNGDIEDILVLSDNLTNGTGTNNLWSFTKFSSNVEGDRTDQYVIFEIIRNIEARGKYLLQFAENRTVCQYLLRDDAKINSLKKINKIFQGDFKEYNITRSNSSEFTLKPSSFFQMCMTYGTSVKSDRCIFNQTSLNMSHIKCSIFDGAWNYSKEYCTLEWRTSQQDFKIIVNEDHYSNSLKAKETQFGSFHNAILGRLECEINDEEYSLKNFSYEAPFLIGDVNGFQYDNNRRTEIKPINYLLPIIFALLLVIIVGCGILKFKVKNTKKGILQEWRATEFPSSLKQENIGTGSKEGSCHSITGSKCSCLVLPQWILDHPDMIFSNSSIKKISVLGSGQFGTVYKGTFTQGHAVFNIAIKCLKKKIHEFTEEGQNTSGFSSMGTKSDDSGNKETNDTFWSTNDDIESLIDEAKTMISLGSYNENIVNLQGISYEVDHSYDTLKQFSLILEYCANGNLRSYLQDHRNEFWTSMLVSRSHTSSVLSGGRESGIDFFSTSPFALLEKETKHTATLLGVWAFQISKGMDFLNQRNIYHGDLAARNVLLTDELVAKVSDFGLSKRLYHDFTQFSLIEDPQIPLKLPMKWLALEVLKHGQVVPEKSDVWSFGVLVWELFQLGAEPYRPDIRYSELTAELANGSRLPPPPCCPEDVFQIMSSCWEENPHFRPSFSQITKLLYQASVLENVVYSDKKPSTSGSDDIFCEEGDIVYTHVLSNTRMYDKYREIQSTNCSYMKMNVQRNYLDPNNSEQHNIEGDKDFGTEQETDFLQKQDNHAPYCHYLIVKSQKDETIESIHDSDSGTSTNHNASVFTDTVVSELTNNSNRDYQKLGRLQSMNEVEEENQC